MIFVALLTAALAPPASAPARLATVAVDRFAKGSPARAYVEFYNAVREDRAEDALKLAQPVDAKLKPLLLAQYHMLYTMEAFKAVAASKVGAESVVDLQTSGMIDPATAGTAEAISNGDAAKISVVTPDAQRREPTEISLKKIGGDWRVFAFDAAGPGVPDDDVLDGYDLNDVPHVVALIGKAAAALDQARQRVEQGELTTGKQVVQAYFDAAQLAIPGIEGAPAANGPK